MYKRICYKHDQINLLVCYDKHKTNLIYKTEKLKLNKIIKLVLHVIRVSVFGILLG